SRLHVIYAYEIGLASCLRDMNAEFSAIVDSRHLPAESWSVRRRGINPTHDYADLIEQRCGIVKYERLLKNPLLLDVSPRLAEIAGLAVVHSPELSVEFERPRPLAVAICHCHYDEVVDELIAVLDRLPDGSQICITSSDPSVLSAFATRWRRRSISLELLA